MQTKQHSIWWPRLATFLLWVAAGASLAFWILKWPGMGTKLPAVGVASIGGPAPTDTGASTQGGPDGPSTGATSEPGSTGATTAAGSTGSGSTGTSTGDGGSTDASTGGAGSDSTGGVVPVAYFDCTELTVVELALKESQKRYRSLIDTAPVAILIFAGERCTYANPQAVRLLGGAEPADLEARHLWELISADQIATVRAALAGLTVGGAECRWAGVARGGSLPLLLPVKP